MSMHKPLCNETFAVHNLTLIFTCAWWEFQSFLFPKPILTLQVQILSALKSDLTTSLAALNPNIQLQLILFTVYYHTHIHVQAELLSYYVDHCFKPQFMRNPCVNPTIPLPNKMASYTVDCFMRVIQLELLSLHFLFFM